MPSGSNPRRRLRWQQAIYIAPGLLPDGTKEILGSWIGTERGGQILACERAEDRGVQNILIAVIDGLKGFPEGINAVFRPFYAEVF